jgi:hypothetical protein
MIQTEFEFRLPVGFLDEAGTLHQEGTMRMATAADEIHPLRDHRVQANPSYLIVIILSRVVTRLGSVPNVNPGVIEKLFSADLAYLQNLYNQVNRVGQASVAASCPNCEHRFQVEMNGTGGS